jgi:uncharacterized protein YcfL
MKQLLLICAVVALVGCGGDPNKKANELFVEAVQLISSGDEQGGEAAIKDYEQGLANIQTIIANYNESDLAVKLISGETLFTGKSLKEIKERVKELKRVAAESAAESAVVMEAAIRAQISKRTGELTKADYEKVKFLVLRDNQLTNVKGLEKLTQLKRLWLDNNPDLTKAQIDELQKALPNCEIFSNPTK